MNNTFFARTKIKYWHLIGMAVTALLLMGTERLFAQLLDAPVAVVRLKKTVNISQRKLRSQAELLSRQLGRSLNSSEIRQLLDAEVSAELIRQDSEGIRVADQQVEAAIDQQHQSAAPGTTRAQFQQAVVTQAGITWDEYREEIRERLQQETYVLNQDRARFENIGAPTEAEIEQFYEEHATNFTNPVLINFEHLFIDTRNSSDSERRQKRQQAQSLYGQIRANPANFDRLLKEALDDPSYSGDNFGYLPRQDERTTELLGKSFIDDVFRLKMGDISNGVLESNVGYHIVRITDRREARLLSLDDPVLPGQNVTVRDQVRNLVLLQKQQVIFQQVLENSVNALRERATITIYEKNLNW